MKLRQRYRFYPTEEQRATLAQVFGACRWTYNTMLKIRTDAFARGQKITYASSCSIFTKLRHAPETKWLENVSSVAEQQALRNLQSAFQAFFDKRSKYPAFKKKRSRQTAQYTVSAFRFKNRTLSVAQLGHLKVKWSRDFSSSPTTVTITKSPAGRYYVTLVLDEVVKHFPKTNAAVGIDLGVNRLATLSNGEHIPNPRFLKSNIDRYKRLQRMLSKRVVGSARWEKTRIALARLEEKIADKRADHIQKVTTDIARRFDFIAIEDLNVRGMLSNRKLSRSISDSGMGAFVRILEYKCAWYGKTLVKVDRFFPSSKRCFSCGHIVAAMPLSIRMWTCPQCRTTHDRDENAAHNILAAGHAVTAQGENRRPRRTKVRKGISRRTVNR